MFSINQKQFTFIPKKKKQESIQEEEATDDLLLMNGRIYFMISSETETERHETLTINK